MINIFCEWCGTLTNDYESFHGIDLCEDCSLEYKNNAIRLNFQTQLKESYSHKFHKLDEFFN